MSKVPLILIDVEESKKIPFKEKKALILETEDFKYDPKSQTGNIIRMGPTKPTTTSRVAGTTGVINTDADESNDDEGTD